MIRIFYKTSKDKKVIELDEIRTGCWVYVEKPTEEELNLIADQLELDRSLLHDATDIHEVPRVEVEEGIVYIFTRFVYTGRDEVETSPMMIAVKKGVLITVSREEFPRLQMFLSSKIDFNTTQRNRLLYKILSQIHSTYFSHINSISKRLRSLTIRVEKIKNRDIIQFVVFENILDDFNSSLVRMSGIYSSLMSGRLIKFNESETDVIEDLSLESVQLVQLTKESLRSMANIREAYSTIMTNNLNQVIKLFTSLTVILTVPTIVASLYGMNVKLPYDQNPLAFFGIAGLIIVFVAVSIYFFKRNDWI